MPWRALGRGWSLLVFLNKGSGTEWQGGAGDGGRRRGRRRPPGPGGGYMRSMAVRMRRQKPVRLKWLWMPSQTKRR